MCYCEKCQKEFKRPKLGPRKVLKNGFLQNVYDLQVATHHGEHSSYVLGYYYKRDLYCPKCGAFYEKMNYSWAEKLGEIAPRHEITRYFEYCKHNGLMTKSFLATNNYPGCEVDY